MSRHHERWRKPDDQLEADYPPASDEPAAGADILEQGSERPPARWRSAVRWRRPPTIAITLGITGLLIGLGAGYAVGTLHAGQRTAPSASSGATVTPTGIPTVVFGQGQSSTVIPQGQSTLECSAPQLPTQLPPGTPGTIISSKPAAGDKIIVRLPPGTHLRLKGCKTTRS